MQLIKGQQPMVHGGQYLDYAPRRGEFRCPASSPPLSPWVCRGNAPELSSPSSIGWRGNTRDVPHPSSPECVVSLPQ